MSNTQANTAIDSLPELLAHALAMETEAAERYELECCATEMDDFALDAATLLKA